MSISMSYNIENRQHEYTQARRRVEKMYPGARLKVNENAGFFIESAEGRNIIALRYPSMAFTDNIMSAYINLDVVSHWNKIEDRNSKKFRNDVKGVCVVASTSNRSSRRMEDYVNYTPDHVTSDGQPED